MDRIIMFAGNIIKAGIQYEHFTWMYRFTQTDQYNNIIKNDIK